MTAKVVGSPVFQVFDVSGVPLSGGKVITYEAGTTTNKATFQDAAGASAHTNPVILDSSGRATIYWGSGLYKVRVTDSADVLVWEVDNFDPQADDLPAPAANEIANGSFESDSDSDGVPDSWTITLDGGTQALDTTDPAHGASCILFTSSGSGGGYADSDYFEVSVNDSLDIGFEIKSSVAGVRNVVEVLWFTEAKVANGSTSLYDDSTTNPTAWTLKQYLSTPPAGSMFARIRVTGCHSSDPTAGNTRFDNVAVRVVMAQYLRSDTADQADGVLTFAATVILNNFVAMQAKEVGGTLRNMVYMDLSDVVRFGSVSNAMRLDNDGTLTTNGNEVYHAGGTDVPVADGGTGASTAEAALTNLGVVSHGAIGGLTIGNGTDADHDIDITAGEARDSSNAYTMALTSTMVKQIDATWAVGTAAGGLFSGTVANTTWYHVFLIRKDSDGSIDAGFDTSINAANIPTGYTAYRRIGSVLTDGTANILAFLATGTGKDINYRWVTKPTLDVDDSALSATPKNYTLPSVPTGLRVKANLNALAGVGDQIYTYSPDEADQAVSTSVTPLHTIPDGTAAQVEVVTNTSAQIRAVANGTATLRVAVIGWDESR